MKNWNNRYAHEVDPNDEHTSLELHLHGDNRNNSIDELKDFINGIKVDHAGVSNALKLDPAGIANASELDDRHNVEQAGHAEALQRLQQIIQGLGGASNRCKHGISRGAEFFGANCPLCSEEQSDKNFFKGASGDWDDAPRRSEPMGERGNAWGKRCDWCGERDDLVRDLSQEYGTGYKCRLGCL